MDLGECDRIYRTLKKKMWEQKHPMHFNKIKKQDAWKEMGNFEQVLQAIVRITTCQYT
jgi:hypothetical protein